MKLELHARGLPLTEELRDHAERRLGSALGRFRGRLRSAQVRLTDVNGPRGGDDIDCRVAIDVAGTGTLQVREVRGDPFAAVSRALDRIAHSLTRKISRSTQRRRRSRPPRRA